MTEDKDDFTVDSLLGLCFQAEIAASDPYFAAKAQAFLDGKVDAVSINAIREYHAAAKDFRESPLALRASIRAHALEAAHYYGKLDNLDRLNRRGMRIEGVREQYQKGLAQALVKGKEAFKELIKGEAWSTLKSDTKSH